MSPGLTPKHTRAFFSHMKTYSFSLNLAQYGTSRCVSAVSLSICPICYLSKCTINVHSCVHQRVADTELRRASIAPPDYTCSQPEYHTCPTESCTRQSRQRSIRLWSHCTRDLPDKLNQLLSKMPIKDQRVESPLQACPRLGTPKQVCSILPPAAKLISIAMPFAQRSNTTQSLPLIIPSVNSFIVSALDTFG